MFKVICLLNRKPGMSMADFIRHYETVHVKLALEVFPQIKEHRRNYLGGDRTFLPPGLALPDCDGITELWFDDEAGFEGMLALLEDPVIGGLIHADEERFLDRSRCGMVFVDERVTRRGV
jgi:hypothetical protein